MFEPCPNGLRLRVKLSPKAAANKIGKVMDLSDGGQALKVSVTTVPENGKANEALIKLLAKQLHIAKGSIQITHGQTDKLKTLLIEGDAGDLQTRLNRLITTP